MVRRLKEPDPEPEPEPDDDPPVLVVGGEEVGGEEVGGDDVGGEEVVGGDEVGGEGGEEVGGGGAMRRTGASMNLFVSYGKQMSLVTFCDPRILVHATAKALASINRDIRIVLLLYINKVLGRRMAVEFIHSVY